MNVESSLNKHLDIELNLINQAACRGVEIIGNRESAVSNSEYIISNYIVRSYNKTWFNFELKIGGTPFQAVIVKNKKKIDISDNEKIESFVIKLKNFIEVLRESYKKIKKDFYISEKTMFRDNIFLKIPYGVKAIKNAKININIDYVYTLSLNNFDMIYYETIDEVIASSDLSKLKKSKWNNLLHYLQII